ncbi:unnamed protein product [Peronospora effusa]|nr:unnamed protein product [Peronospora effusa]
MFELSTSKDEFASAYKLEIDAGTTADVDVNGLKLGRWSSGFLEFYGDCIPNGFMAFLCPGVSVAQIMARLGLMRYKIVLQLYAALYFLVLLAISANNTVINVICVVAAIVAALAVARLRTKMRTLFDIPGNALLDVTSAFVCGPCTIAQMASHAEAYQSGSCSFRARSTLEGYQLYHLVSSTFTFPVHNYELVMKMATHIADSMITSAS